MEYYKATNINYLFISGEGSLGQKPERRSRVTVFQAQGRVNMKKGQTHPVWLGLGQGEQCRGGE